MVHIKSPDDGSWSWVDDSFAKVELQSDGNIVVTSLAEEVDDQKHKLGDDGVIFDTKWVSGQWPVFENEIVRE